jgi:putative ABC transport system permease protein
MLHDVRYAVRSLLGNRGTTITAVAALALGIGCTTAVFSVVDGALLRALPYGDADRIVAVGETDRADPGGIGPVAPANYLDWKARSRIFAELAAVRSWAFNLSGGDKPERLSGAVVSADLFPLTGIRPALGRTLLSRDEAPGADRVVVLGHALWIRRFGGDRGILGRAIALNGEAHVVVGVMPAAFDLPERTELWVPAPWGVPAHPLQPAADPRPMRDRKYLDVYGKLKAGVTVAGARADLDAVGRRLAAEHPDSNEGVTIGFVALRELLAGPVRPPLLVLMAAVAVFLVMACANVAGLLLVRASERGRELALRVALGASPARIARLVLAESLVLALVGGLAGTMLTMWLIPGLLALAPPEIAGSLDVSLDASLFGVAVGVSALTGFMFGALPAWQASRAAIGTTVGGAGRGGSQSRRTARSRAVLAAAQIALSIILLVAAGLLSRTVSRLMAEDPGFRADRVLVFSVSPSTPDAGRNRRFYDEVAQRIASLPGVQAVGAVSRLPLSGGNSSRGLVIPGQEARRDAEADLRVATPGYFGAMGIPVLAGRPLDERDTADSAPVAVINQALARRYFAAVDPIGRSFTFGDGEPPIRVVGVVGNVRHVSLEIAPRPEVYLPLGQSAWPTMWFAVKAASADPLVLRSAVERAVWGASREVPVANLRTMREHTAQSESRREFTARVLSAFAGLSVLLAAIGLYGVVSFAVARRAREFGVRMALGASTGAIARTVLGQALVVTGSGTAAGLAGAFALARAIPLLAGVSASDPLVFTVVPVVLAAVALAAAAVPARRAMRVNPAEALRSE